MDKCKHILMVQFLMESQTTITTKTTKVVVVSVITASAGNNTIGIAGMPMQERKRSDPI